MDIGRRLVMPETTDAPVTGAVLTGSGKPFDCDAALKALDSLLAGDENEQRETLAWLQHALDEGRLPDCKLFP
jgi:hypothetical protein